MARSIIDKLWDDHLVADLGEGTSLLYIDRVFLHERTGSVALKELAAANRRVRNPEQVFCTMDHIVDTLPGRSDSTRMPGGTSFITQTREAAHAAGITLFDIGSSDQGIVHVVSPEQGIALPGVTLVCPDSHTCTLGGIGALAWGIGSTEAEHALATKTLAVRKPRSMRIDFQGRLAAGVTAKDMILALIGAHSASGGVGYAIEFAGEAVRALPVEARLTLCNMGVEFGAWTVIIAPDQAVFDYVRGRPYAPRDQVLEQAIAYWRTLPSDPGAVFDREITLDCSTLAPQVTWGTSPQHETGIDGTVPDPAGEPDTNRRQAMERALAYMALQPGTRLDQVPIQAAFIGSCTNSRLSDLRARLHPGQAGGGTRGPGPRVSRGRVRVARVRLLDVLLRRRRELRLRGTRGLQHQSQLREPPGATHPHPPGEPGHRGRLGHRRPPRRCPRPGALNAAGRPTWKNSPASPPSPHPCCASTSTPTPSSPAAR